MQLYRLGEFKPIFPFIRVPINENLQYSSTSIILTSISRTPLSGPNVVA